jgi:soluble lytic murein transglycosylase-like protein
MYLPIHPALWLFPLLAGLLLLTPARAHGDIYRYVDEHGVVHFTDAPTTPQFHLYFSERENIGDIIHYYAGMFDLEEALLRAVIKVESDYNPHAVSQKGAMGLMQLIPATAGDLNVNDPMDVSQNIRGGSQYLKQMLKQFKDLDLALAAYNAGPNAVKQYGGIPPYAETVNYVRRVKEYLDIFRQKGKSTL